MDPFFATTLIIESISNLANVDLIKAAQKLAERASNAHQVHKIEKFDVGDPIELLRNKCLSKICELQHELILEVSDGEFLKKVLPLLLEHIGNIYEASTKQELTIIDMSLSRIEHAINSFKDEKIRRKKIRMYAVLVSLGFLVLLGLFVWVGSMVYKITVNHNINILAIPVPVLLWSIIGSCAAILYRFTNAGDKELNEPLRWLFARPLTGVIMGVISYLVIKVGLVTIQGQQSSSTIVNPEIIWLIAFLAGFSDRFSESLLKTVVGKFGGDKEGELVSTEVRAKTTKLESSYYPTLEEEGFAKRKASTENLNENILTDKDNVELKPVITENDKTAQTNTIETKEIEVTHINNSTQ